MAGADTEHSEVAEPADAEQGVTSPQSTGRGSSARPPAPQAVRRSKSDASDRERAIEERRKKIEKLRRERDRRRALSRSSGRSSRSSARSSAGSDSGRDRASSSGSSAAPGSSRPSGSRSPSVRKETGSRESAASPGAALSVVSPPGSVRSSEFDTLDELDESAIPAHSAVLDDTIDASDLAPLKRFYRDDMSPAPPPAHAVAPRPKRTVPKPARAPAAENGGADGRSDAAGTAAATGGKRKPSIVSPPTAPPRTTARNGADDRGVKRLPENSAASVKSSFSSFDRYVAQRGDSSDSGQHDAAPRPERSQSSRDRPIQRVPEIDVDVADDDTRPHSAPAVKDAAARLRRLSIQNRAPQTPPSSTDASQGSAAAALLSPPVTAESTASIRNHAESPGVESMKTSSTRSSPQPTAATVRGGARIRASPTPSARSEKSHVSTTGSHASSRMDDSVRSRASSGDGKPPRSPLRNGGAASGRPVSPIGGTSGKAREPSGGQPPLATPTSGHCAEPRFSDSIDEDEELVAVAAAAAASGRTSPSHPPHPSRSPSPRRRSRTPKQRVRTPEQRDRPPSRSRARTPEHRSKTPERRRELQHSLGAERERLHAQAKLRELPSLDLDGLDEERGNRTSVSVDETFASADPLTPQIIRETPDPAVMRRASMLELKGLEEDLEYAQHKLRKLEKDARTDLPAMSPGERDDMDALVAKARERVARLASKLRAKKNEIAARVLRRDSERILVDEDVFSVITDAQGPDVHQDAAISAAAAAAVAAATAVSNAGGPPPVPPGVDPVVYMHALYQYASFTNSQNASAPQPSHPAVPVGVSAPFPAGFRVGRGGRIDMREPCTNRSSPLTVTTSSSTGPGTRSDSRSRRIPNSSAAGDSVNSPEVVALMASLFGNADASNLPDDQIETLLEHVQSILAARRAASHSGAAGSKGSESSDAHTDHAKEAGSAEDADDDDADSRELAEEMEPVDSELDEDETGTATPSSEPDARSRSVRGSDFEDLQSGSAGVRSDDRTGASSEEEGDTSRRSQSMQEIMNIFRRKQQADEHDADGSPSSAGGASSHEAGASRPEDAAATAAASNVAAAVAAAAGSFTSDEDSDGPSAEELSTMSSFVQQLADSDVEWESSTASSSCASSQSGAAGSNPRVAAAIAAGNAYLKQILNGNHGRAAHPRRSSGSSSILSDTDSEGTVERSGPGAHEYNQQGAGDRSGARFHSAAYHRPASVEPVREPQLGPNGLVGPDLPWHLVVANEAYLKALQRNPHDTAGAAAAAAAAATAAAMGDTGESHKGTYAVRGPDGAQDDPSSSESDSIIGGTRLANSPADDRSARPRFFSAQSPAGSRARGASAPERSSNDAERARAMELAAGSHKKQKAVKKLGRIVKRIFSPNKGVGPQA